MTFTCVFDSGRTAVPLPFDCQSFPYRTRVTVTEEGSRHTGKRGMVIASNGASCTVSVDGDEASPVFFPSCAASVDRLCEGPGVADNEKHLYFKQGLDFRVARVYMYGSVHGTPPKTHMQHCVYFFLMHQYTKM